MKSLQQILIDRVSKKFDTLLDTRVTNYVPIDTGLCMPLANNDANAWKKGMVLFSDQLGTN